MSIKCDFIFALFSFFCASHATHIPKKFNNLDIGINQVAVPETETHTDQNVLNHLAEAEVFSVEKVTLEIFYECLCPGCRYLETHELLPLIGKLGHYVNIQTYPYGNAKTYKDPTGHYYFQCQHGPKECYGNMLHACALDILKNHTEAILFNICMIEDDSNDAAADACGRTMGVDATSIKDCAKGEKGTLLLKYYGDLSNKANFKYVPYIVINGKVSSGDDLMEDVCSAFKNPPEVCNAYVTY